MLRKGLLEYIQKPVFPCSTRQDQYWLLINGGFSQSLEDDVVALNGRRNHCWLWRGKALEYGASDFRQGPLLVPLNKALFDAYLGAWAPAFAGLILTASANKNTLLDHLTRPCPITTAQGNPVRFHLGMLRQLEELALTLNDSRIAQVLGPIESLIWRSQASPDQWLTLHNPFPGLDAQGAELQLYAYEEAALNHANSTWFMQYATQRLEQEQPELVRQFDAAELIRRLSIFKQEADVMSIARERDLYRYFLLRLRYPEHRFVEEPQVLALLSKKALDARMRLSESEYHLDHQPCAF